ncbi:MAG: 6-phosphogluconolactonase [Planctomycetota bacterium]
MADPYELNDTEPAAPALPGEAVVLRDAYAAIDALAERLMSIAVAAVERRDAFDLAVVYGPSLDRLFTHLCIDPRYRLLPWESTGLWVHDAVPQPAGDRPDATQQVREGLVEYVPMDPARLHAVPPRGTAGRKGGADGLLAPLPTTYDLLLVDAEAAPAFDDDTPSRLSASAAVLALGNQSRPAVRAAELGLGPAWLLNHLAPRWFLDPPASAD